MTCWVRRLRSARIAADMKAPCLKTALLGFAACAFAASAKAADAQSVANASALDRRWVYLHLYRPMTDEAVFSKATNIVATAAAHHYTGIMFSSAFGLSSYHVWTDGRRALMERLVKFVDSFGLEKGVAMWLPGYPKESFFPIDPNLSAANPVFGTRYRVENGKCVHVQPPHRELVGTPATVHSPLVDGDLETLKVKVKPRRSYRLAVKARCGDGVAAYPLVIHVRRPGDGTNFIQHRPFTVKKEKGETLFETDFPSMGLDEVEIICCGYNRNFKGSAEVVSIELRECAPMIAVRRHGTPVTVRNAKTKVQYAEGRDYAQIPKAQDAWPGDWIAQEKRFAVRPLPSGRIKDGDELVVDCYSPFPVYGKWQGACMGAVEMDAILEASAAAVAKAVKPGVWLLALDEVRTGGGCEDCLAIGDMAHVYAAFAKKCMAAVRRHADRPEFYVWNDMVDPYCLSNTSRKGEYVALYSKMKGVWDLLPRDLGIAYWRVDSREKGLPFFARRGHPVMIGAYYDAGNLDSSVEWAKTALGTPGVNGGIMYCTWCDKWDLLGAFGDEMHRLSGRQGAVR